MSVINVATEDDLSEAVACRLVRATLPNFDVGLRLRKGGVGYLRSSFAKFRQMAAREPVLLLTDLDTAVCPPHLIQSWQGDSPLPPTLLMRVAVREVESWILADRVGLSRLLGISMALLPQNPDQLLDPKAFLLNLARRASRNVRTELLAMRGTTASQGLGYNRVLSSFVEEDWSIDRARAHSDSLSRAMDRLGALTDDYRI